MSLSMKEECERCGRALDGSGRAFICSYECTWCPACAGTVEFRCPNCGGELVARPRRDVRRGDPLPPQPDLA